FATTMSGMLLVYAWIIGRHTKALVQWAVGYLVGAVGTALIVARGSIPDFWSIDIANTLLTAAYGIMLMGTRSFDSRNTPLPIVIAGAVVWLIACQIEAVHESLSARIMLVSSIIVVYTLAAAIEFWRASDRQLPSRWPLIFIFGVHAAV